jgi:two-component system, NarL family, sensor histidine kinase BarA
MSYRSFKRLLGENNLERKCRILLGVGIVVLMTVSFWLYAHRTEDIAYEQMQTTGQLLVPSILAKLHTEEDQQAAMKEFQAKVETTWPETLAKYRYKLLKPKAQDPENKADGNEVAILNRFVENPEKIEESHLSHVQSLFLYYGAIRAEASCVACHSELNRKTNLEPVREGDLMAVLAIRLPTQAIESGIHQNRALLISTAMVTSILIMLGSYLIIRYVIVKPVKHLKLVSDNIAAGHVNVRSDIQTGDEFEDLSNAFNRMIRKLMAMREESEKLNVSLDRKVDELAQANMALHQSDRIKGDFLATMSHELRTPLNSILGFSDVLLANTSTLTEKQARWVTNIKSNGQQLLNLITDILDLAKIEAGKMDIRAEELSPDELCDSLIAMFRPMAEKKRIELRPQYERNLPTILQDGVKLRQILSNLLSNAIKFSPEGGRVELDARFTEERIRFVVTDNGIGIALEDQQKIFEKFRQSANPMTREHEGSGLGLSIVHELCKLLGGSIQLKSEPGQGSQFTVTIPVRVREGSRYDFELPTSTDRLAASGMG